MKHNLEKIQHSDLEKNASEFDPAEYSQFAKGTSKIARISKKIETFGIEGRGIARILENERTDMRPIDNMWIWMGANMTAVPFSAGCLGPVVFNLGFRDSIATVVPLPPAYFATFGPPTGLRQMTFSRYSFGWIGTCIMASFNILACIGWSVINSIVGAQILRVVSNNNLDLIPGICITAILTFFVSVFGYRLVHHYERYAWIPILLVFLILLGKGAKNFNIVPAGSGPLEAASILSFGGSIYGYVASWASYSADYSVKLPVNTSRTHIFIYAYAGLLIPLIFIETLGVAYACSFANRPDWAAGYAQNSMGGLIGAGLADLNGFGKFLLVLLALSMVAQTIPDIYSLGLSAQVYGSWSHYIPRYIWTLLGTMIYVVLAILGRNSFVHTLETLLVILGYWITIYTVILVEEHLIVRKNDFKNYDLGSWDSYLKLPWGIASVVALCFGVIGVVLGMSQQSYIGPIAKLIGSTSGSDIAFELAGALTAIVYPIVRSWEFRKFGR